MTIKMDTNHKTTMIFFDRQGMAMICKWVGSGSSRGNGLIFYSYMEKLHSSDETTRSGFNHKFSSVSSLKHLSRLESLWNDLFA